MVTRSGTITIRCEIEVEVIGLDIAATGHDEVTDKAIIDALCAGEFDGWDVGDPRDGGILAVVGHTLTEDKG